MSGAARIAVTVAKVVQVNALIKRFRFVRSDGGAMPAFSGGAHSVVEMQDGPTRRMNPYSLMGDPADLSGYEISVRRDEGGRGGSLYLHKQVTAGMQMVISHPVNLFPLDLRAKKHLLIAGGIGITPFLAQIAQLSSMNALFELHYSARSPELGAYMPELKARHGDRVQVYFDDHKQMMPLAGLLAGQPLGTHLYVCGPKGFMDAVLGTARGAGWPEPQLHYEFFSAEVVKSDSDGSFEVKLASSGRIVRVPKDKTVVEALAAAGVAVATSCEQGVCGTCLTRVLEGTPDHRDMYMTPEEQSRNDQFTPCCSRSKSESLVLDL